MVFFFLQISKFGRPSWSQSKPLEAKDQTRPDFQTLIEIDLIETYLVQHFMTEQ